MQKANLLISNHNFYVCIECGQRQHRLINQLQEENYCLEKCSRCAEPVDKYVEFEINLLALQVVLCKPQIYRHIFFNIEEIVKIKRSCLIFTLIYLTMLYWYENRIQNLTQIQDYVSTQFVPGLSAKEQKMHTLQSQNLALLYYFDQNVLIKVISSHFSFIAAIFILALIFKMYQTQQSVNFQFRIISQTKACQSQGDRLFWRLWLVLIISQVVYVGVAILIVWNYNLAFFKILKFYSLYSTHICLKGVVNSRYELYISIILVAVAYWISLTLSLFLSQWQNTATSLILMP